jgi:hypothetical protein
MCIMPRGRFLGSHIFFGKIIFPLYGNHKKVSYALQTNKSRLFSLGTSFWGWTLPPSSQPTTAHHTHNIAPSTNRPTMISSAFTRSRPLMARYDVSPHMTKWWKAVRPDDGQVRRVFHRILVRRRCGNQGILNPTLALRRVGLRNAPCETRIW